MNFNGGPPIRKAENPHFSYVSKMLRFYSVFIDIDGIAAWVCDTT